MNERLKKYLDDAFSSYEDLRSIRELKEEMHSDLDEKMRDLMAQGHDEETAYQMTIESMGDISEIVGDIAEKTRKLRQTTRKDLSMIDLRNSDLAGVAVHDGKFNCSDLRGSDFSGSDLKNSTFKGADLKNVRFDGAEARFTDGRSARFDAIVLATGYRPRLGFLDPAAPRPGDPVARAQRLHYCGFDHVATGMLRQIGIEARAIARAVAAAR
jgi:hypothetical protein